MGKKLRFTGDAPPIHLWEQFPNWEYALDEEGEEGQDETTLRPAANQTSIDEHAAFTAGTATLADGTDLPALLEILQYPESCEGVNVFIGPSDAWRLKRDSRSHCWSPFEETWLPPKERRPAVSMGDPKIFPLKIRSRLPVRASCEPFSFFILANGETQQTEPSM